jgi:hypothetical protein
MNKTALFFKIDTITERFLFFIVKIPSFKQKLVFLYFWFIR